jgi:A118 family predicted phage portal protein
VFLEYESGLKLPPPDGVEEFVDTGIPYPLFQIIEPNIANNVDITSPLGISVFANAIDALKAVDLTFDSWCSEYQLGRKRLIVPMSMAQKVSSVTVEGREVEVPLFDPNDTVFYGMDFDDENQKPFDHSPEIRAEQHLAGLTANLALLSIKCGLGANRYSFDRHEGVKTATEVVSEQSDLYQTLCKHELVLTDALKGLARALLALTGIRDVGEIKIKFDDSIIQDKNAIRNEARTDVAAGLMSKKRYLLDVIGMNEAEADAELAQIASESRVSMDAVDLSAFGAGG